MTSRRAARCSCTIAIFALLFLVPAWPWLSGAVTIPYDAKSTFSAAGRLHGARLRERASRRSGRPNVFAGWPNIADPQSMLASPLHVLLALVNAGAGLSGRSTRVDVRLSVPRRTRNHPLFPRPRLARGRRAGRGAGLCVRRRGERAAAAHRAGHQPRLSADRIVSALARARSRLVALRRGRRRRGRADRRSGATRSRCSRSTCSPDSCLAHWLGGAG